MNRGGRHQRFLGTLGQSCAKIACLENARRQGWQIHVYCFMGNQFHLIVERP
ncbi:MAG: hypothetical protein AAB466_02055 [Verrucomicrobiota bacterium]